MSGKKILLAEVWEKNLTQTPSKVKWSAPNFYYVLYWMVTMKKSFQNKLI